MSVTTVSFHESTLPSETYIASLSDSDGPPFTVHGVALGSGDITKGASGIKKKWPANELEEAADSLEGTNLVVDHENNADGVVGTVTKAGYKKNTGVVYQADLYKEELAEKIENDLLEVSIRGYHADVENLEEDDETGALIVEDITFDNLSIVPTGAAPSNTLNMGSHEELSFAELQSFTASLVEEPEPGMWVKVDDMHGITISQVQNGEIEVDIYEESDGQWRSTGEVMMVDTDDLETWDVEESDIGQVQDESGSSDEEAAACLEHVATLMGEMSIPMPGDAQLLYPSEEKAEKAAEMMNMDGIHSHQYEGEEWYMPGKNHEVFVEKMSGMSSEENEPLIEEGMTFFSTVNNSEVVVKSVDGNIALVGTVEGDSQWKEEIENIINKLADGDWEHSGHMEEMIDTPDWSEGEMVQWQVMPEMKGKIVHNPEDEPYVMVEVMENGEPSGYTLTAGYTDIVEMESDEMAEQQFTRGDWVNWDTRNSTEIGKVIGGYTKGDDMPDFRGSRGLSPEEGEILYALRMYKERDGAFHPIEGKPIGHYEDAVRSAEEPANVSESSVELSTESTEAITLIAELASEPMVERPTSGNTRMTFHTPLKGAYSSEDVDAAVNIAEDELGEDVSVEMTEEGVFVEPIPDTGAGSRELMHMHLDVIESAFDNKIDIQQKSTLFIGGNGDGMSVQPSFEMNERFSDEVLDEIARLCRFVTGVDAAPYYEDTTLHLNTGEQKLAHANLDVAEILVRRMADNEGITVTGNSLMVADDNSDELGRSNHEQYDVEEEEWVQWYPSEMSEEHGFVLDVDESAGGEDETIVTIEVWTQNSDGEWETDGEEITKAMELVEPWGNFPRKQEEFADAISGEDPRRAVKPGEEEATSDELISEEVEQALRDKAEKHNEEHAADGDEGKRVTYRMLKNVFERGMGAYQDSHREGMTPQQWSYARVNAFLYLVRNGNPENDAYTQDNDLLPEEHPKYNETGDSEENALTTADVIVSEVFGQHDPMGSGEYETAQEIVEKAVMAELEVDQDELDDVYSEWSDSVNMSAGELREWSAHPCSREASLAPVEVMKRNLELLETAKSDWDEGHIEDAKRTISFIARMRGTDTSDKDGGPHDCPSKRDISLLNWAYNPFDEIPDVPDNEGLDSVSEVELARTVPSEEDYIETLRDRVRMMRNEPERFTRQQTNRAAEDIRGDVYGAQVDGLSTNEGETRSGEASDVASLAEFEMHEVSYEGAHEDEWDRPNLEDFVEEMGIDDDISEYDDLTKQAQEDVASAFILSASGFPAENYTDLKLPVVEPSGELSVRALAAVKGGRGASAVDNLSEEMEEDIIDYVNQLASEEFDRNWSEEENMPKHYGEDDTTEEYMGGDVPDDHMFESRSDAEDKAEDMGIEGAHQMGDMFVPGESHEMYMEAVEEMSSPEDSVMVALPVQTDTNKITITNMSELEEELEALDSPVAVEAEELEALEQKADRLDTMSESLEELRERTEVLDEVDQSDLEELRGADDPMIVEAAEYEELSAEAEDVKNVYAASLAEEYDAFDKEELTDRYSIEELRSKFEDTVGDVEEELTATSEAAEPRSQDVSEEQMTQTSEEELADEVAEKQAEIREKILSK